MDIFNLFFKAFFELVKKVIKEAVKEALMEAELQNGPNKDVSDVLDRKAASEKLGISLPTLDLYTDKGVIKGRRIGKKVVYMEHELVMAGEEIRAIKHKKKYDTHS